jgi:hypothetical protein
MLVEPSRVEVDVEQEGQREEGEVAAAAAVVVEIDEQDDTQDQEQLEPPESQLGPFTSRSDEGAASHCYGESFWQATLSHHQRIRFTYAVFSR